MERLPQQLLAGSPFAGDIRHTRVRPRRRAIKLCSNDMPIRDFFFGRFSKARSALPSMFLTEPHAVRLPLGPSPWAFRDKEVAIGKSNYRFQEAPLTDSKLSGLTLLQDSQGRPCLILDFYYYLRVLNDGTSLLWRECGQKQDRLIVFDAFQLSSLPVLSDHAAIGTTVRNSDLGHSALPPGAHWEFKTWTTPGLHSFEIPYDWSPFEETLVLADYGDSNHYETSARAIYVFDWMKRQVEVIPQDWFNTGNYDFGYQWITRVARRTDGSIVGDGIRLGQFQLDETNRQVKKWLTTNPFYMID